MYSMFWMLYMESAPWLSSRERDSFELPIIMLLTGMIGLLKAANESKLRNLLTLGMGWLEVCASYISQRCNCSFIICFSRRILKAFCYFMFCLYCLCLFFVCDIKVNTKMEMLVERLITMTKRSDHPSWTLAFKSKTHSVKQKRW